MLLKVSSMLTHSRRAKLKIKNVSLWCHYVLTKEFGTLTSTKKNVTNAKREIRLVAALIN
jgi:hypothetical protein